MILHDAYAIHRKWWDFSWEPDEHSTDWCEWDFILADVAQVIDDYTNKETGAWLPFDQSGEVDWDVKVMYSGSKHALDKAQKDNKLKDGESYYPVPSFRSAKPTIHEWIRDMNEDKADGRPEVARDSRPPTPEELAAMG